MPPSMTRVRAPWATIVPVEMERGEVMVDTPPLLSPSATSVAGKPSCEPRAMNYTRGAIRSEAQASMASGVRDTTLFKKSYTKHLKSINSGVGEMEGSRGRVAGSGGNVPPQLSSATSSTSQRVLLSPITSKTSMDAGERGRETRTTAFDDPPLGYLDEGRSKGKRVRGLGGAVYRGATVVELPLPTSNEAATNASAPKPSTGPVPDETSSRANRITQNSRYLKNSNKLADSNKPPLNTIDGSVGESIPWGGTNGDPSSLSSYHSSPRERKRLQHEAAVAEGLLWGTDVQTTAVISGGTESSGPRGEREQQSRHAPSVPPNTKVAARLALLARLNDSSVARNAAEAAAARGVVVGKSGDGGSVSAVNPLLNRKLDQWSKEYVDGRAGFPSTWASDRHIIPYSIPKDEDVGRSSSPQRIHSKAACLPQGGVVPLFLPSNTRNQYSPISCLPSGDDAAPQRATGKATNIPSSSVSTRNDKQQASPPRHDNERHGKSTRKLIPAQVHALTSAEGGRYFLAPEPSSFPRRKGGQQQELCNSPDNRVMMGARGGGGANKIKVAVSPDGRYLSPSPHSKSSRSKSKNSRSSKLGGFSVVGSSSYVPPPPSPPTLSMATENVVATRVHTLLKDSAESLLQHKELMQTLARWNDRNNSSEGDGDGDGGGGGYQ